MSYLKQYVAENLDLCLRQVDRQGNIITVINSEGTRGRLPAVTGVQVSVETLFCREVINYIQMFTSSQEEPLLIGIGNAYMTAVIPNADGYLLTGPIRCPSNISLVLSFREEMMSVWLRNGYAEAAAEREGISVTALLQGCLLLYYEDQSESESSNCLTVQTLMDRFCRVEETSSSLWEKYNDLIFRNMENGIIHNPYNQEIREFAAVERGDLEEVKRIQEEDYTDRNGVVAFDAIRQERNIGIVNVTLCRAAAQRAGVSPEACYSLSDVTIQEMERCQDVLAIRKIYRSAEIYYTRLVRSSGRGLHALSEESEIENLHIKHCKDYIFSHLHGKITVQQVAAAIGLERNYLSTLFRKYEDMTLKQYILQEKIKLVKNMLSYSEYSYVEIANYLGFSSQSHLGEQFRKATGTTMSHYRERHKKEDFLQETMENELK